MSTEQIISSLLSPTLRKDEQAIVRASKIQLPPHSHDHLSPTQMTMYWRCGMQYWYRYGLGIKSPPGVALVEGGSHHKVFAADNKYKKKTGKNRSEKWLCQRFADAFSTGQGEISRKEWKFSGQNKDSVIRRGKQIQQTYAKRIAPYTHPEVFEERVAYKVGDVKVQGVIDVAGSFKYDGSKVLGIPMKGAWDYKVVKKKMSDDDATNAVALSHYGWATVDLLKGVDLVRKPPRVGFISFTKTITPGCHVQTALITVQRIKWYRKQVLSVADAISRGSFPVRDGVGWQCSSKFCGYYSRCKGKVWRG